MKNHISVIIPAYNRANYIVSAIESVLNQKGNWDIEVIVVDDGSTDETELVLKPLKNKVRYFKIKHSGKPAVARNFGISKAKGDLIALQDSDDLWSSDKLQLQVPLFDNPEIVMSYGNAEVMSQDGKLTGRKVVKPNKLRKGEIFADLLKENVISTLTVMFRKSVIKKLGGFNESDLVRAVEDYELWLRIAAKYPKGIKGVARALAHYRVHDQNISTADPLLAVSRLINVYNEIWRYADLSNRQKEILEKPLLAMHENWSRLKNEAGDTPSISVVMGIYKDEKYVKKAVDSILKQEFNDFEYIIIDDGCKDKSVDIVSNIKDDRIRLIHQINHGLVSALNNGVKIARAPIIARMDADDISLPKRFKKEYAWISQNPKRALVGSFFSYIDERDKLTGGIITSTTKHIDIVRHMYFDNPIGHGSTLIRKQAILDAGGYRDDYGPNEDYDLWRRIVKSWEVGQLPEILYHYRLNPAGISSTKMEAQHKFFTELVKDIWKGPVYKKSIVSIIRDAGFYKKLDSPFAEEVYKQYKSHQVRLSFEFLIHGKLMTGYLNSLAALIIYPLGAIRLWNTWLWAPVKLLLGKSE